YTADWMGRRLTIDLACDLSPDWTYSYDTVAASGACPAGTAQGGRLATLTGSNFTRAVCYHPNGMVYGAYQQDVALASWSNSNAVGTTLIYDANGNLKLEYVWDFPSSRSNARAIRYTYDGTLLDRVSYVQHELAGASSWTSITSTATLPTYFAMGGMKTVVY